MNGKKKTGGAFKRKQRQRKTKMKKKLPKMDTYLTKCDISTVSTEIENVDSSDDSMVTATISNEKLTTPAVKEPLISTFIELFTMSNDLGNFVNKIIK